MTGHTIQFVITRVRYIRDSLYRGNLCGVRQNPRGQIYFCYTVKLVIAGFDIIGIHCSLVLLLFQNLIFNLQSGHGIEPF